MPVAPTFPTIPVPATTLDALYYTCAALKQAVEQMQGARGVAGSPRMFVQDTIPVGANDGDFWLVNNTLSIFQAGQWYLVGTLA